MGLDILYYSYISDPSASYNVVWNAETKSRCINKSSHSGPVVLFWVDLQASSKRHCLRSVFLEAQMTSYTQIETELKLEWKKEYRIRRSQNSEAPNEVWGCNVMYCPIIYSTQWSLLQRRRYSINEQLVVNCYIWWHEVISCTEEAPLLTPLDAAGEWEIEAMQSLEHNR